MRRTNLCGRGKRYSYRGEHQESLPSGGGYPLPQGHSCGDSAIKGATLFINIYYKEVPMKLQSKLRRTVILVLCLLLVAGVFASCGKKEEKAKEKNITVTDTQ